jgi:hypothetical protein
MFLKFLLAPLPTVGAITAPFLSIAIHRNNSDSKTVDLPPVCRDWFLTARIAL